MIDFKEKRRTKKYGPLKFNFTGYRLRSVSFSFFLWNVYLWKANP